MIADLLESHQKCQNQPTPLDACGRLDFFRQLLDRLLVQGGLRLAQDTPCLHFSFFRQIANDPFVGFKPAQNVRLGEIAQWAEMAAWIIAQTFDNSRKIGGAAQKAWTNKIEERPKIANPVFDRRAGEYDPRLRA